MPRYRIGIDTGGTFTDVVAIDAETGALAATKTPSTPDDPSQGLVEGIDKVLREVGGAAAIDSLIHGTTVATNALLEERFHSLGLIVTRGFRHILEIARQSVPSGYGNSYFWVKPERIVPLSRVREVTERLNFRGEVLRALNEEDVRQAARFFREQSIVAIAVSLIHAYANPVHERRVRELLLEEYPEAVVSISSDVLPEYREYERTMTTAVDAFVKPVMQRYVERAVERVATYERDGRDGGNGRLPFLIMQSNGGVLSAREVARQPITTLLSGPAAGALGAGYLAAQAGHERVLTVDAGGTSTDICLVDGGVPHVTTEGKVGRFPVKVPMVDIATIGTGGGSIGWIDASGALRVGPRSAGADPGPMCYGRGGTEPTLTDANVALGRLPPSLLGGEMTLDVERARAGLQELGERLGLSWERLAAGMLEIADWSQVNAIRQVTVRKGLDPRDYTLVPFGGSGPLQATHVAELLGINTVVVPPNPGNVSAFGLLAVDLRTDYVRTCVQRQDRPDLSLLQRSFEQLEEQATHDLGAEGVLPERRRLVRSADLRYFGQAYEVRIDVPAGEITPASVVAMAERFHQAHHRLYGYDYRDRQVVEIVNVRMSGIGLVERPRVQHAAARPSPASVVTPILRRETYLDGEFVTAPVYARAQLAPGARLDGPAVIQEYGSTTVIPLGWEITVDAWNNLVLARPSLGTAGSMDTCKDM